MARRITGKVIESEGRDGRIYRALRFSAYGKRRYVSLGPVSQARAERELEYVLADVERGVWQERKAPVAPEQPKKPAMPTFHQFSDDWWLKREGQLAKSTLADYKWRLEVHLLKFFEEMPLDEIKYDTVERYIAKKLAEDNPLSPSSINMTITLLGAILEDAVERELIPRNPARGRGRKVRGHQPQRTFLENAEQISALLLAAGEIDHLARVDRKHVYRKAIIATLVFAGLRVGELCALRWRDVDFDGGWLHIQQAKTDAGRRQVKIRHALRQELLRVHASTDRRAGDHFVFGTDSGGPQNPSNIRNRVLAAAVEGADEILTRRGRAPLPRGLTPHSLRRTFCSLLYALGEDPGVVMDEMGHTDPALSLRVYRQAMRRGEDEKAALRALVDGAPEQRRLQVA